MADTKTSEEVLAHHIEDMGPELGSVYNRLYQDLTWLHMRWRMFRQLFGTSSERIEVLNAVAPAFFSTLQRTLLDDVILGLARLADPPTSIRRHNLSLLGLPALIDDPPLRSDVEALLDNVVTACAFSRDWRNRQLAHRDLALALGRVPPLTGASRADVETALRACRDLLNRLEGHYRGGIIGYEHSLIGSGDGDSLIHYLEKGLETERTEQDGRRRRMPGDI